MNIALDATYSVGENLTGVGVYSREILRGLAGLEPARDCSFSWCYRPHRYLKSFSQPLPQRCRRKLLLESFPPHASVFHGLNQRLPSGARRAVSTFHDLFVLTGDYSTPEFRARFAQQARDAAARSDLIIAVSQFTASQVEALLRVEQSRIRTVWHGVRRPAGYNVRPEQVILSVGTVQRRKNTARLVEAFAHAPAGWKLILAGSTGFGADETLHQIEKSPRRADITLTGYVDESVLNSLYERASIFAFPSLDEGFGMPALEAMARGIPVLSSNRGAMKEVCGDAALLVDPTQTEAMAHGLRRLIDEEVMRKDLSQRGIARAAQFTWERAARETWNVYREMM